MVEIVQGWQIDVERGPDWLFVRLHEPDGCHDETPQLAEQIWRLLEEHGVYRLVVELDEVSHLPSYLISQLLLLLKRLHGRGGLLRLCGLSPENSEVLSIVGLRDRFPEYPDRSAAVMGHLPHQPR